MQGQVPFLFSFVMFGLMKACGLRSLKLKLLHTEPERERERTDTKLIVH